MDGVVVCVGIAGRNVVGVLPPILLNVEINDTRRVVRPEDNIVLWQVIGRVEEVEWSSNAIEEPELLRTFRTVKHSTAVSIGIAPVRPSCVFNSIRNTIVVKVVGQDIVRRVVFWIGVVEIFRSVVDTTAIGVHGKIVRDPNVIRTVVDTNERKVASRGVFEIGIDPVTIRIESVETWFCRIRVVKDFVIIAYTIAICISERRVREPAISS